MHCILCKILNSKLQLFKYPLILTYTNVIPIYTLYDFYFRSKGWNSVIINIFDVPILKAFILSEEER